MNITANRTRTYTTVRLDGHGYPLPGAPVRQYRASDPANAARLAADGIEHGPNTTVTHQKDWPMGGTWTFQPRTGAPVHIRVTVPEAEPLIRPAIAAPQEPTRVTRRADNAQGTIREITPDGWVVDMDNGTDVTDKATAWKVEPLTVDEAAYAADDAMFGPEDTEPESARTVVAYVTIKRSDPNWAPVFAMADALATEPDTHETSKCTSCGATVERYDTESDWVDVDEGGNYDVCPERYDEATDTQRPHVA